MTLASKKQTIMNGTVFRVFKAGTGTYQCKNLNCFIH
jgi:hypothetical protein